MIYLASPYSDPSSLVRQSRYEAVLRLTAQLLTKNKLIVVSPIVYCHQMALTYDLPEDAAFWSFLNNSLQRKCDSLIVACLEGWTESKGIRSEIEFAKTLRQPIQYMDRFGSIQYTRHTSEDN